MCIKSPPALDNNPPNKNKPWGEQIFNTINLDGGTITPLINNDFWSTPARILKNGGFVVDRKSIDL